MKTQISLPTIKTAKISDEENMIATLTLAFSADPVIRWVMPEPKNFLMNFPKFVRAFGGNAFTHETAYYTEGYAGVALWLPPNIEMDAEKMINLIEQIVPNEQKGDTFGLMEQMEHYHPDEPIWYLPLIGVDPFQQNRGQGSILLAYVLKICDREAITAYLETSNPRNITLYERHGFEIIGKIQAGNSPVIYPMLRHPQN